MLRTMFLTGVTALSFSGGTQGAMAKDYFLASGRWDNVVLVIDLEKAIDPANDGTAKAVVNRLRVTPDIEVDGKTVISSGQPITIAIAPDYKRAYAINHSGRTRPEAAAAFQHGHAGTVTVIDLKKALDPASNNTLAAVEGYIETGGFGPTGFAITADGKHAALAHAEREGDEDGGRHISIVDLATNKVIQRIEQAYGKPGFPCPPDPVPHRAPDPKFGCFPDTNGVTISPLGGGTIFGANGGTDDISVISLQKAIAGAAGAEVARIPVQAGGFGISTSPDGKLVAHASRENAQTDTPGNTVSIIDVEKALSDPAKAEVARVLVGTDDKSVPTRPFVAAFLPDGKRILSTHFRSNNIDFIDVEKAIAGQPATIKRVELKTPGGEPSRPRGIAITPDGKYAAITGAPKGKPNSSVIWIVDLASYEVKGRVTEIGNESYMIGAFQAP
ncbi:WD40-like Beta Propeller Repeat [Bosea lathyri]|uniref:WD40-like Beta Propeller Repeat n=2 Tax=Bosea lathyri TaxID=1036778 RepID=A0A1H5W5Q2_9HYPH|nr:WD40-like Beta Propeller Repeat [Bosea lathyri]